MKSVRIPARLALLAMLCAALAATLSMIVRDGNATAAAPLALTADGAVAVVPDETVRSFAIFRDQKASPMPADIASVMASPAQFRRNADLARSINTPNGEGWIVPGDGVVCIVVPDPVEGYGTGCVDIDVIKAKGNVLTMRKPNNGPGLAVALTADGSETVLSSSARRQSAPSTRGVSVVALAAGEALEVQP